MNPSGQIRSREPLRQELHDLLDARPGSAILPTAQRLQLPDLDEHLLILLRFSERLTDAPGGIGSRLRFTGSGQDLGQGLMAGGLLGAVAEAPGGLQPFLRGAACLR